MSIINKSLIDGRPEFFNPTLVNLVEAAITTEKPKVTLSDRTGFSFEIPNDVDLNWYVTEINLNIKNYSAIDFKRYVKIFTDKAISINPQLESKREEIERIIIENLIFTIYQSHENNFLRLQNDLIKFQEKDSSLKLVDFCEERFRLRHIIEKQQIDTGYVDIDEFIKTYLPEIVKPIPGLIDTFYRNYCEGFEQLNYNHTNTKMKGKSILPKFNVQTCKHKRFRTDPNETEFVFFKSNYMFLSFSEDPDKTQDFHFMPNNQYKPGIDRDYGLALLFAGFENLIYALDNNLLGPEQNNLTEIGNLTNLTQAIILLKFGFEASSGPYIFKDKNQLVEFARSKQLSKFVVKGKISEIRKALEKMKPISDRLKDNFDSSLISEYY